MNAGFVGGLRLPLESSKPAPHFPYTNRPTTNPEQTHRVFA